MKSRRLWLVVLATVSSVLLASGADAQRTRALTPVPYNDNSPVQASVSLDQNEPKIGSMVSICFQASKPGFATLWNISTAGEVARVFPNQYSQVGPAAQIEANKRYCAGTAGDPFRFRVDGPAGTEDLYLLWTTRTDLQPSGTNYADANALVQDMQRLGGANAADWGTAKITYDIIPAAGNPPVTVPPPAVTGSITPPPAPAPAPPPQRAPAQPVPAQPAPAQQAANDQPPATAPPADAQDGPKVWILAMGANVEKLTKSNQDAAQFTMTMMQLFPVPEDHVRFLENGKNADFVAGMDWLTNVAQPRDFVFIYFSGHGGRFKSASSSDGWDEFLVPYDFEDPNADPKNLLFSQRLAFMINRLQTKNVVAVIDACHSAGVYRALQADVLGARNKFYHLPPEMSDASIQAAYDAVMPQPTQAPRTRAMGGRNRIAANGLLLAAAKRDQSALESSKGSYFTLALVHEMNSSEGGNLVDVFNRTVKLTEEYSQNRQDPEAVGDLDLGRNINFSK
jgi:hypothetical protein